MSCRDRLTIFQEEEMDEHLAWQPSQYPYVQFMSQLLFLLLCVTVILGTSALTPRSLEAASSISPTCFCCLKLKGSECHEAPKKHKCRGIATAPSPLSLYVYIQITIIDPRG